MGIPWLIHRVRRKKKLSEGLNKPRFPLSLKQLTESLFKSNFFFYVTVDRSLCSLVVREVSSRCKLSTSSCICDLKKNKKQNKWTLKQYLKLSQLDLPEESIERTQGSWVPQLFLATVSAQGENVAEIFDTTERRLTGTGWLEENRYHCNPNLVQGGNWEFWRAKNCCRKPRRDHPKLQGRLCSRHLSTEEDSVKSFSLLLTIELLPSLTKDVREEKKSRKLFLDFATGRDPVELSPSFTSSRSGVGEYEWSTAELFSSGSDEVSSYVW